MFVLKGILIFRIQQIVKYCYFDERPQETMEIIKNLVQEQVKLI